MQHLRETSFARISRLPTISISPSPIGAAGVGEQQDGYLIQGKSLP
jgi:hypothetical protein